MYRVVINEDYGGFGLSLEAKKMFLEALGIKNYIIKEIEKIPKNYMLIISEETYNNLSDEKKIFFSKCSDGYFLYEDSIPRHNKLLVKIVLLLGEKANGFLAKLKVKTINSDKYYICDYDGYESIITENDLITIKD